VASEQRAPQIPDTPTFPEVGLPQVISSSWFCLGAPSATPPETIKTLSTAMGRVLQLPGYRTRLAELGLEPFELSPPEATAFIARELEKWTNLVALADIKAE
jgi:tripartite-type tricarboxylate transporter receptor subunit TctC